MVLIGGAVSEICHLSFEGVPARGFGATLGVPSMLEDHSADDLCEVQAASIEIRRLENVDDAQGLPVVVEVDSCAPVQDALPFVAEGWVSDIVDQCQNFAVGLIEPERLTQEACQLTDFQGVGQSRPVEITLVDDEDLGLVLEPSEGTAVKDAVSVAHKAGSIGVRLLRLWSLPALGRECRPWGELLTLKRFALFSGC